MASSSVGSIGLHYWASERRKARCERVSASSLPGSVFAQQSATVPAGVASRLASPMAEAAKSAPSLAERLLDGDKRALARAITLIESNDPAGWELVREVYPRTGRARITGFTGPPGVGKSTLIGALTAELRRAERDIAVLSIDPSSPFTRGALLGDRIRLSDHFVDPGVYIRSMASRGALGGLSEHALQAALVMDAAGKQDVLIETVGVGQGEIDIVDHADTIVLVLMPGSGDSIQALKAGVMEIPDLIVVNKADHPMTETMVREIRGVLSLAEKKESWKVPILRTEASEGEGVPALASAIDEHRAHIEAEGTLRLRRARNLRNEVLGIAAARLRRRLEDAVADDPQVAELLERVVKRELDPASAAGELLERQVDG
jgi:LAO/AO transport system kinase